MVCGCMLMFSYVFASICFVYVVSLRFGLRCCGFSCGYCAFVIVFATVLVRGYNCLEYECLFWLVNSLLNAVL